MVRFIACLFLFLSMELLTADDLRGLQPLARFNVRYPFPSGYSIQVLGDSGLIVTAYEYRQIWNRENEVSVYCPKPVFLMSNLREETPHWFIKDHAELYSLSADDKRVFYLAETPSISTAFEVELDSGKKTPLKLPDTFWLTDLRCSPVGNWVWLEGFSIKPKEWFNREKIIGWISHCFGPVYYLYNSSTQECRLAFADTVESWNYDLKTASVWGADGKSVFFDYRYTKSPDSPEDQEEIIGKFDLTTRKTSCISKGKTLEGDLYQDAFATDTSIYFSCTRVANGENQEYELSGYMVYDARAGTQKWVWQAPLRCSLSPLSAPLSPDGRFVAYFDQNDFVLVSLKDGKAEPIYREKTKVTNSRVVGVAFSPDSHKVCYPLESHELSEYDWPRLIQFPVITLKLGGISQDH